MGYHPAWTDPESHRREGKRARGGKEALGSRAAAVCVISRGCGDFLLFPAKVHPARQSARALFGYCRCAKRRRRVTVDNGKVREGGEGGSGAASVYSIAIAASLPNCWRTLSLSGQTFFFFLIEVTSVSHTHASGQSASESLDRHAQWQLGCVHFAAPSLTRDSSISFSGFRMAICSAT